VLITNASIQFVRIKAPGTAGGLTEYALYARGQLALVGLDGLTVTGEVILQINNSNSARTLQVPQGDQTTSVTVAPGSFQFVGAGVRFAVDRVFEVTGTLALSRAPNGTLDIALANAGVGIFLGGEEPAITVSGNAAFQISPVTGFRLQSFRVNDFTLFEEATNPAAVGLAAPAATAATLFPTADVGTSYLPSLTDPQQKPRSHPGRILTAELAQDGILVVFNDLNGVGINPVTILDAPPEFDLFLNGNAITGISGVGTAVAGRPNTYRYLFSTVPTLTPGVLSIQFRAQSFADNNGIGNFAETEFIHVVNDLNAPLAPLGQLAGPANGEAITVDGKPNVRAGDALVRTTLSRKGKEPVVISYRMRQSGGRWRIVDVLFNGSVSQLATRRADYAAIITRGGAKALIAHLGAAADKAAR